MLTEKQKTAQSFATGVLAPQMPGEIAWELESRTRQLTQWPTSDTFGKVADPSKYIPLAEAQEWLRRAMDDGANVDEVIKQMEWAGYVLEWLWQIKRDQAIMKYESNKSELPSKRSDSLKNSLIAPIARGGSALVWVGRWFLEWTYEALVPSTVEAFGNIKNIRGDEKTTIDEKFTKTVLGEIVIWWIGWWIWDITWSTLEWAARWFTTDEEKNDFKNRITKQVTKAMDTDAWKSMLSFYQQLPESGKQEVGELARDVWWFLDLIDVVALWWAYSVAKKPLSNASKQFINSMLDAWNVVKKTQADELINAAITATETKKWLVRSSKDFVQWYLATKAAGLTPEDVITIKSNPLFPLAQEGKLTRRSLGDEVVKVLWKEQERLSDLWPLYQKIRESKNTTDFTVVTEKVKNSVLDKYKISVDETGKLDFSNSKFKIDKADQIAIQNWFDVIGDIDIADADLSLNMRHALSSASRFGTDVTGEWAAVVREMREELSKQMTKSIPWLKELDETYWPQREKLQSLLSDYYKKDGEMRENFYSTIANITNQGKELKYDRLSEVMPDLEVKVAALKARNNVENAVGAKTWIYDRLGVIWSTTRAWAGFGGYFLWPVWSVIWWILWFRTGMILTDVKKIVTRLQKSWSEELVQKIKAGKMLMDEEELIVKEAARSLWVWVDEVMPWPWQVANKLDDTAEITSTPPTIKVWK